MEISYSRVAELVDAPDLKSVAASVWVRVPSLEPIIKNFHWGYNAFKQPGRNPREFLTIEARLTQLGDVFALEAKFCRFESYIGHHASIAQ